MTLRAHELAIALVIAVASCGVGRDESGSGVACELPPPGLRVPFRTSRPGAAAVRWPLGRACVRTTVAPTLARIVPVVRSALDAWGTIACSRLCFAAPVQAAHPPLDDGDRRLHIGSVSSRPDLGSRAVLLSLDDATGLVRNGTILVDESMVEAAIARTLRREIGRALGLLVPAPSVDSMMSRPDRATASPADEASVCAIYGRHCALLEAVGSAPR